MNRITTIALVGLMGLRLFAEDRVKFAIGEWEPYTGQQMESQGMVTEIVTAACIAAGLKVEYAFFPWRRAESNVEAGSHFATFPYRITKDRSLKYDFSDTLIRSSNGILFHKGNPRTSHFVYANLEDLKDFRIGIIAGADAIRLPLQQIGADVEEVQNVDQNIKKLASARLDCVIDDRPVLFQALRKTYGSEVDKLNGFRFSERGFGETTTYCLLVSRKYPNAKALLQKFNAGLKQIKAGGAYQKILKNHGM